MEFGCEFVYINDEENVDEEIEESEDSESDSDEEPVHRVLKKHFQRNLDDGEVGRIENRPTLQLLSTSNTCKLIVHQVNTMMTGVWTESLFLIQIRDLYFVFQE